jgi:hypothetical protein
MGEVVTYRCKEVVGNVMEVEVTCRYIEEEVMVMKEVVTYRCKEVTGNEMEVEATCRNMKEEVMVMVMEEGICRHMEEVVTYRHKEGLGFRRGRW